MRSERSSYTYIDLSGCFRRGNGIYFDPPRFDRNTRNIIITMARRKRRRDVPGRFPRHIHDTKSVARVRGRRRRDTYYTYTATTASRRYVSGSFSSSGRVTIDRIYIIYKYTMYNVCFVNVSLDRYNLVKS